MPIVPVASTFLSKEDAPQYIEISYWGVDRAPGVYAQAKFKVDTPQDVYWVDSLSDVFAVIKQDLVGCYGDEVLDEEGH